MALKVGIQLYSVRDEMAKDPIHAIETVARAGYKYLEIANHNAEEDYGVGFGVDADTMKEVLEKNGSRIISGHIRPINDENYGKIVEYNQKIGNEYIICPAAFFDGYDAVMRTCEEFNALGKKLKEDGLYYLYHNHYHEFQEFNGKAVLDLMMENTDPAYMGVELDTYWAMRGGQDVLAVMDKIGSRLRLIHQKDYHPVEGCPANIFDKMSRTEPIADMETFASVINNDEFTEIGTGCMDIQSIINKANELGSVEYVILEQDFTHRPQLESIAISMDSFRKFDGIILD